MQVFFYNWEKSSKSGQKEKEEPFALPKKNPALAVCIHL